MQLKPEVELDVTPSELQNKLAILINQLYSAQYQVNNLNNPVVDRKTRIAYTKQFLASAIDLVVSIRNEI